jgi:AraC-like DNA-binding protein
MLIFSRRLLLTGGIGVGARCVESQPHYLFATADYKIALTDLSITPVDFSTLLSALWNCSAVSHNAGAGCDLVGGHFLLTGGHAEILLGSLPPIVHIRKDSDKAKMRWSLDRMKEELRDPQPGGSLVAQQLAYMMLVQALRLHLADGASGGVGCGVGWLFALADKQMSAAITCMHDDPAHGWTLQELAERVGMSRSIFALRFKETVGATPMENLTRWRMLLAGDRIIDKAFKRVMGCSPRRYSRAQKPAFSSRSAKGARANRLESVAAV